MPCYTPDPTEEEMNGWGELSPAQAEAVLCGLLRAIDAHPTIPLPFTAYPKDGDLKVDWREVGVTPSLVKRWFVKHKAKDARRRRTPTRAEAGTGER